MSGSCCFFPHPSAELQHQLLAKNKHHSSTIYVHWQARTGEERRQVSPSPSCRTHMWPLLTMHITQLNRECLLHLFSFLDKDSRKSLARTCSQLHEVFEDPALWSLLHFRSLTELQKDNFLLGPALRSLSICWHSSRVQVCSIEDWLKSAFQRSICSQHESLVNDFLLQVCDSRPRTLLSRGRSFPTRGSSGYEPRTHVDQGTLRCRGRKSRENGPARKLTWNPASRRSQVSSLRRPRVLGAPIWHPSLCRAAATSPTTAWRACFAAAHACVHCAWRTARASPTAR
ncbi:F-box and leucine-rich protein 22 isoform X1 [Sapajus apella]|uniref:F-box and leucine-rich protein 22 n=1 Tax=Sapajus apella TaxID=9515 RepID=A0A6J3JFR1_SAPAP|nr:F-box and leucine-rich protein 22 isoform X1 [Sapajus apella]